MCWNHPSSTPGQRNDCNAAFSQYIDAYRDRYGPETTWSSSTMSYFYNQSQFWSNLPYDVFAHEWNRRASSSGSSSVVLGGVAGLRSAGTKSGNLVGWAIALASTCVLATNALYESRSVSLSPYDFSLSTGAVPLPPITGYPDRDLRLRERWDQLVKELSKSIPIPYSPDNDDNTYYFRGTTVGYSGSRGAQRTETTPTSLQPAVATVFATVAETMHGGDGVVYITSGSDLQGVTKGRAIAF
jgi:hypothetical protein